VVDSPALRDPTIRFGLFLAGCAGILRLRPLGAPDLWWHLSVGRTVLDERARRFPDVVGIPPRDEFVAGEWLFDVLAVTLYDVGGSAALVLFAAAATTASFLLVWALARLVAGPDHRWCALGVTAVVSATTAVRFFPRPHILFLVLLPATLLLATKAARAPAREQPAPLAGLLVVVAIWSQCHPSVMIAPVVVAAAGAPWVLGARRPSDASTLTPAMWAALAALCAIPLLSPYGVGLIGQMLGHAGTDSTAHIGEMHPMPADWWWPPRARSIFFVEILVLTGALGAVFSRRIAIGPAALAAFGLVMTLNTHRFRSAWAILLVPLVVDGLRGSLRRETRGVVAAAVAVGLVMAGGQLKGWGGPDLGLDPRWVPTELGEAVLRHQVRGPIFNDYDAGGYLGWTLYGEARVFIDGRTPPFFTDDHFFAMRAAMADPEVFARLDAGYRFTAAVVPGEVPLHAALVASPDWAAAWTGPRRTLFLRTQPSK
jgi:hypothetical protein